MLIVLPTGGYNTHQPCRAKDLIRDLKKAGWIEDRVVGSHHTFRHPTIPHPKKDLGKGLLHKIRKQAGLK